MTPGCRIQVTFFGVSSLFQHVDLVTTSLRARFQVYFLRPGLRMYFKAVQYEFGSHFLILCFLGLLGRWNH